MNNSDNDKQYVIFLRKLTYYNKFKKLVEQKKGILISEFLDYKNAHSKLKIKCSNDHIF